MRISSLRVRVKVKVKVKVMVRVRVTSPATRPSMRISSLHSKVAHSPRMVTKRNANLYEI